MAVVIIGISLSQVYGLGMALRGEGENSCILADRLYYIRKDSEFLFWEAARAGEESRMGALENWAEAVDSHASQEGQASQDSRGIQGSQIRVSSWLGKKHTPEQVFSGQMVPESCYGIYCMAEISEAGDIFQPLLDAPPGCIHISGKGVPGREPQAAGTSIYLENPRAATLFLATGGDFTCPG